jgi:Sulfotransferase family
MPVCIAGMHRSGTSMIARLLNECGLYIGEKSDLLKPSSSNPGGYWENKKLMDINKAIIRELGGWWFCPPQVSDGSASDGRLLDLRRRAEVVLSEFMDHEPWGWKDPRNSVTLSFWRRLVSELKVVIGLRHPLEVALSLHRRNGFSLLFGVRLWRLYNERLLETCPLGQRIVTHYDAYFPEPSAEVRRLLEFLGMPAGHEVVERACSVVTLGLRHHGLTTQDLQNANVPADVVNLYTRMCTEAGRVDDSGMSVSEVPDVLAGSAEQPPWRERLCMAAGDITAVVPPDDTFVLVDDDRWRTRELVAGRRRIRFLEQDGHCAGRPADDAAAILELERLRKCGATFVVFAWPAFAWLDDYPRLARYLRSEYRCVLENDRLVAFDLRR